MNQFRDNPYQSPEPIVRAELNEPKRLGRFPWATVAGLFALFLAGLCLMLANVAIESPLVWLLGGLVVLISGLLFLVRMIVWIATTGFTTGAW